MSYVVKLFIAYVIVVGLYYGFLQVSSFNHALLNQISNIGLLILHLSMILGSSIILKKEYHDVHQLFIARMVVSAFYLGLLYLFLTYGILIIA